MRRPEIRESVRGLVSLEYLQNAKMADSRDLASGTEADPIINGYGDLLKHLARALLAASLFAIALFHATRADMMYTYTGNGFNGGGSPGTACPSVCLIDSTFSVSTALGDNFSGVATLSPFDFYISTAGSGAGQSLTWSRRATQQ